MLRTIEMYTNEYKDTTQKEIRKNRPGVPHLAGGRHRGAL